MRWLCFFAVLLGTYSLLCLGQTGARYTVTGSVVNSVTGEPIRRALVAVNGAQVFTGADGRFEADNVPEGIVTVSAQKPGYFDCLGWNCPGEKAQGMAQLTLHSNTSDVSLKLVPEAKIQGRIVDESGDPISNMRVTAASERIENGRKQIREMRAATTDENGNYEIAELMPGSYRIQTWARPAFFAYFTVPNGPRPRMYPERFYPNTPDASAAQKIELKGGQNAEADVTLPEVPAFRISGSVSPPGSISVTAEDGEGQQTHLPYLRQGGAKFVIQAIPAGTWKLDFSRQTVAPGQQEYYAEANVTVGSADITNLQVLLEPLPSVTVQFGNGSTENSQAAQVQLISQEPNGTGYGGGRQAGSDGPYEITNVRPGRYRVVVFGGNQCVDSVSSGNVDLTHDDFVVSPGSQGQTINVTFRSDCASLEVRPRSENSSSMTSLLLLGSSRAVDAQQAGVMNNGAFTFRNLPPGDYRVYAFSNIEGLEYTNPEVMRQYSGQEITLAPNQQASVTLDVIAGGDK